MASKPAIIPSGKIELWNPNRDDVLCHPIRYTTIAASFLNDGFVVRTPVARKLHELEASKVSIARGIAGTRKRGRPGREVGRLALIVVVGLDFVPQCFGDIKGRPVQFFGIGKSHPELEDRGGCFRVNAKVRVYAADLRNSLLAQEILPSLHFR